MIPAHLAAAVAEAAAAQELKEAFIMEPIQAGAVLHGTYPLDEAGLREFEEWRQRNSRS